MQTEFWDARQLQARRQPRRADWKQPGTRPAAETEQAFRDFEQYIRFIKEQPGVRFVTATELKTLYADRGIEPDVRSRGPAGARAFRAEGDHIPEVRPVCALVG